MNRCIAKRGIFTLQPCGEPASASCAACQAPMCPNHLFMVGLAGFCARCYHEREDSRATDNWSQPGWSQRWRDDYHQRTRYTPFHSSGWNTGYFDDGDYAALANQPNSQIGNDDDGGGFSDS
jgi:hypothetical protein